MIKIKRPILVAVIGYIIGILWGLYFKWSIVLFYLPIIATYKIIKKLYDTILKGKKINSKVIYSIIIISIISNSIIMIKEKSFENFQQENNKSNTKVVVTVVSDKNEKEYKDIYEVKYENKKLLINVPQKERKKIKYGDRLQIKGKFIEPEKQRNYGGFDYSKYLKSINVYGTIDVEKVQVISNNEVNLLDMKFYQIKSKMKENIYKMMDEKEANILLGILLGDTSKIDDDIKENFSVSNISHILAVSGMHITYLIIGINAVFKRTVGKRKTRMVIIFVLLAYMKITDFPPSIVRAGVMGIILMISQLIYRKNDTLTSMAFSLLVILMINPYQITNIGLQFSYLGTLGIILFHKEILENMQKINSKIRNIVMLKLMEKIEEILAVTFSVQVMILPVMIIHFNMIGIYFWLTNLLISMIIGPIVILAFVSVMVSLISLPIAKIIAIPLAFGIYLLELISEIGNLPFSKIYIATPKFWQICIYYIFIFICMSGRKNYIKKTFIIIIILVTLLNSINVIFSQILKSLKIYFVDVGQGDCTFIVTPKNQTILIDGGGSEFGTFNVGKSTVIPYILDRGYTKVDYMWISHFDMDHVRPVC